MAGHHYNSKLWCTILSVKQWLQRGVVCKLNGGHHTLVYQDRWVPNLGGLLTVSNNASFTLFPPTITPLNITVSDLFDFDSGTWYWTKVGALDLPNHVRDFLNVTELVPNEPDSWSWMSSSESNYTVRVGYDLIFDDIYQSTMNAPNQVWKLIWQKN